MLVFEPYTENWLPVNAAHGQICNQRNFSIDYHTRTAGAIASDIFPGEKEIFTSN